MEEFLSELVFTAVAGAILIVPLWKIHARAGFAPTTSLLVFVPFFGFLIVYLMLAFRRWPNTEMDIPSTKQTA